MPLCVVGSHGAREVYTVGNFCRSVCRACSRNRSLQRTSRDRNLNRQTTGQDGRFGVAVARMCAGLINAEGRRREWTSRFNILRMFPRFRLTKSDNRRCFLERMTGSFVFFVFSLSPSLPSLLLTLLEPSRERAIDRSVGDTRGRDVIQKLVEVAQLQFQLGRTRAITVSSCAHVFSRYVLRQCLMNVQSFLY